MRIEEKRDGSPCCYHIPSLSAKHYGCCGILKVLWGFLLKGMNNYLMKWTMAQKEPWKKISFKNKTKKRTDEPFWQKQPGRWVKNLQLSSGLGLEGQCSTCWHLDKDSRIFRFSTLDYQNWGGKNLLRILGTRYPNPISRKGQEDVLNLQIKPQPWELKTGY